MRRPDRHIHNNSHNTWREQQQRGTPEAFEAKLQADFETALQAPGSRVEVTLNRVMRRPIGISPATLEDACRNAFTALGYTHQNAQELFQFAVRQRAKDPGAAR